MIRTIRLRECLVWCGLLAGAWAAAAPVSAQPVSAGPNQDFIIVLDQSGSMREKISGSPGQGYHDDPLDADKARGAVEALHDIANNVLKDGDYFAVITFGEDADLLLSQELRYQHEKDLLMGSIERIPFRDKHTDIITGLKEAGDLLTKLTPGRRKILVMITDGVNEPPPESPYSDPARQDQAYDELRELFDSNSWDVALVGLGAHTDISEIARRLNLPPHHAIVVDDSGSSQQIADQLSNFAREVEEGQVNLEIRPLKVTLKPKLFGGYDQGTETLRLTSAYQETTIEIQLDPRNPLHIQGTNQARVSVQPLTVTLAPQQSAPLNFTIDVEGERPVDGRIQGFFTLQFADKKTKVFPADGQFDIFLQSWWEVYGVYAIALIVLAVAVLLAAALLIRKSMVPEIRIVVAANGKELGAPVTLKTKKTFTIGNDDFGSHVFSAKGLSCKTAATGKYLGRRKFELTAADATIVDEGKEVKRLVVGLDKMFDLKGADGKVIRGLSITKPGGGGDMFGSGGGDAF
jgi:hypothetical protein